MSEDRSGRVIGPIGAHTWLVCCADCAMFREGDAPGYRVEGTYDEAVRALRQHHALWHAPGRWRCEACGAEHEESGDHDGDLCAGCSAGGMRRVSLDLRPDGTCVGRGERPVGEGA